MVTRFSEVVRVKGEVLHVCLVQNFEAVVSVEVDGVGRCGEWLWLCWINGRGSVEICSFS